MLEGPPTSQLQEGSLTLRLIMTYIKPGRTLQPTVEQIKYDQMINKREGTVVSV